MSSSSAFSKYNSNNTKRALALLHLTFVFISFSVFCVGNNVTFHSNEINMTISANFVRVLNTTDKDVGDNIYLNITTVRFEISCTLTNESHLVTFFYEGTNVYPTESVMQKITSEVRVVANNFPRNVGIFGCQNTNTGKRNYVYVFSSDNTPPYLLQNDNVGHSEEIFAEEDIVLIPCKCSNPLKDVLLYKNDTQNDWIRITHSSLKYHHGIGFSLNVQGFENKNDSFGHYICTVLSIKESTTKFPSPDSKIFLISPPKGYSVSPSEKKIVIQPWEKVHFTCLTKEPVLVLVYTDQSPDGGDDFKVSTNLFPNKNLLYSHELDVSGALINRFNNLTIKCAEDFNWDVRMRDDHIHIDLNTEFGGARCTTGTKNTEFRVTHCFNRIGCHYMRKCLNSDNSNCNSEIYEGKRNCQFFKPTPNCTTLKFGRHSSGILSCSDGATVRTMDFYTGLDDKRYDMDDKLVDTVIMKLTLESVMVYTGNNITGNCSVVSFFLTQIFQWGVNFRNGSSTVLTNQDSILTTKQNPSILNGPVWTRTATLNIHSADIVGIFCRVPLLINNVSQQTIANISVKDPFMPRITNNDTDISFALGSTYVNLICKTEGSPIPTITWEDNKNISVSLEKSVNENGDGVLQFPVMNSSFEGLYTCVASNFKGISKKNFTLRIKEERRDYKVLAYGLGSAGIITGFILIIGVALLYNSWRENKKKLRQLTDAEMEEFVLGYAKFGYGDGLLEDDPSALPYNSDYEIPITALEIYEEIGSGAYGKVLKASWTKYDSTITVAVKTVSKDVDILYFKALLSELKIMVSLGKNENIVILHGAYTKEIKNKKLHIVLEYCEKGDLGSHLRKHRKNFVVENAGEINSGANSSFEEDVFVTRIDLYRWSMQIAKGMHYLGMKKVIHGDLATRNVLLTVENIAKITDFGLSKQLYDNPIYRKRNKVPVPWKWTSIEGLRDNIFSTESDMWSFGVTLWEIFSLAESPYPGINCNPTFLRNLLKGQRLQRPPFACERIYTEMLSAWNIQPAERPTFQHMADTLREIIAKENEANYMKL